MKRLFIVLFFCFIEMLSYSCSTVSGSDSVYYDAKVTAVVDGDTIRVLFSGDKPAGCDTQMKLRLIGINAPELYTVPPETFSVEAAEYVDSMLYGKTVRIYLDDVSDEFDRYGRLLGYVYYGDTCVNELLLRKGYAVYYDSFAFNPENMSYYANLEKMAKSDKNGLWAE